jgi:hypothetical protein
MGEFGSFSLTQNKIKIVFKGKKTKNMLGETPWCMHSQNKGLG